MKSLESEKCKLCEIYRRMCDVYEEACINQINVSKSAKHGFATAIMIRKSSP